MKQLPSTKFLVQDEQENKKKRKAFYDHATPDRQMKRMNGTINCIAQRMKAF